MNDNTDALIPTSPLVRVWRGATRADDAEAYLTYLRGTGLAEYRQTRGNRGVLALRRILDGRAELVLLTLWQSEAAIRGFAGDDIARAVFYPEDDRYLVERDLRVQHYELVFTSGWDLTPEGRADE